MCHAPDKLLKHRPGHIQGETKATDPVSAEFCLAQVTLGFQYNWESLSLIFLPQLSYSALVKLTFSITPALSDSFLIRHPSVFH